MIVSSQIESTYFNGTDEYAQRINGLDGVYVEAEGTFFFVFKKESHNDGHALFALESSNSNHIMVGVRTDGRIQAKIQRGGTSGAGQKSFQITSNTLNNDEWYYVAYSKSSGNAPKIWINGVNQTSFVLNIGSTTEWGNNFTSGLVFKIGKLLYTNNNGTFSLKGSYNKFAWFNKELNSTELLELQSIGLDSNDYSNTSIAGNLKTMIEFNKLNPTDNIGISDLTSVLMDNSNLVSGDILNNQGLIVSSQEIISTSFNGNDELISVPHSGSLDFERTNSMGFTAWVDPVIDGSSNYIVSKRDNTAFGRGYDLYIDATGYVHFGLWGNFSANALVVRTNTIIPTGGFVLISASYTGVVNPSSFDIKFNGVSQSLTTVYNSSTLTIKHTEPFRIGAGRLGGGSWNGKIDDVAVFNLTLTQDVVDDVISRGRLNPDYSTLPGIVSHWKLNKLNPQDQIGINNGTSILMDDSNLIIEEGNTSNNQGLIIQPSFIHTTFDGTNEYISVADDTSLAFERTNTFSFSFWMNKDTTTSGTIINKRKISTPNQGYTVLFLSTGKIAVEFVSEVSGAKSLRVETVSTFSLSTWYHVVVTYDGSSSASGVNIYVDGSNQSLTTISDTLTTSILVATDFKIGIRDINVYFDGKIDKVIIYDKELTAGEVTTIYNYDRIPGLIGIGNEVSQWELDTLNPVDVIENTWTTFDGTNEYISADGTATSCATNTVGSWSLWVNFTDITPAGQQSIIGFGDTNANSYLRIISVPDGKLYSNFVQSGVVKWQFNQTTATLSSGTWYHIVLVQNGVEPKLYINGSLASITFTTTTDKTAWNNTNSLLDNFTLGVLKYNSTFVQYFNGKIDKVIIYDDVLTSGEITTIYNYGRKAGLIGIGNEVSQWELDTLNPTDEIGSNDGTSTNMDSSNILDNINNGTSVNQDETNINFG